MGKYKSAESDHTAYDIHRTGTPQFSCFGAYVKMHNYGILK